MKDIIEYLENKRNTVDPLGGKTYGTGATILRFDKSDNTIEDYVHTAIQAIMSDMQRSDIQGLAKLTKVSTSIGRRVLSMMGDHDAPFDQQVRLGDLFMEALFKGNYVNIYRDPAFSEHNREAPYVVHLGLKLLMFLLSGLRKICEALNSKCPATQRDESSSETD